MSYFRISVLIAVLLLLAPFQALAADPAKVAKIQNSTAVLNEIMASPDNGIPADLLRRAQGIAVIPSFLKAGFIFGADYGKGVLVRRSPDGTWSDPAFVTIGGGNFGLQIGAESTDLILVFTTPRSLDAIEHGKLLLGGTISVAAGPVGRSGYAATDATLRTEVFSYSRSRGIFAGVALDGAALSLDYAANRDFYGVGDPMRQRALTVPDSARRFACTLASYTGGPKHMCA